MSDADPRGRRDPIGRRDPRRRWRFRWRLAAARVAQAFERLWPALWPPLSVLGVFLAISLFGLWHLLPGWLHGIGLVAFAAALGLALFRARVAFTWPSRQAGLGRLELVNALAHQPLRSLDDQLSSGHHDPLTRSLWQRHRERLTNMIGGLKVGLPRSDLPRRDRWALRIGLALILIVAVVESGSMGPARLVQAFDLHRPDALAEQAVQLTVWVTPPAYTGLPAEALELAEPPADEALIDVTPSVSFPAGSELLAQLHHVDGPAERYMLSLAEESLPFTAVGGDSAEAKRFMEQSGELRIGDQSDSLGVWQVDVVEDVPPTIAFADEPAVTQRQVMRFAFESADDYGINSIALLLARPGRPEHVERIELIQPAEGATELDDAAFLDLTPHPWSGLPVEVKLEAVDGLEQTGVSETRELTLPTRNFTHPVARAIVELRRQLADEPERRERVAASINSLSHVPEHFQNDPTVFMALRSMATRLMFAEDDAAIDEVLELMWETALHLEDGSLSLAGRELRDLQEALRDALANDASDEELSALMNELRQALDDYLDALAQQQQEQQTTDQPMQAMDPDSTAIERQDLEQMLDSMRDMIETGAREAAQEMLAQLQELLENLQVGQQSGQMQQGEQMLNELQDMIQQQQDLLDETFGMSREQSQQGQQSQQQGQLGQQGQQGQQGEMSQQGQQGQMSQGGQQGQQGGLAGQQEALRRALGELMQSLGENGVPIPRAMGEAELSMRSARDALSGGQPGQALDPQASALDQLRQGGQAMMQEMQQMMGQNPQNGPGQQGQQGQQFGQSPTDRDPLGRSPFNRGDADVFGPEVPTDLDLGKARSIMEELHRRAGQRHRPTEELDYLERLLRRF